MPLRKLASSEAHSVLAELISLDIMPPTIPGGITSVARSEEHHIQVLVTIADYSPATISAETLAKIEAMRVKPRNTPTMKKITLALAGQPFRKAAWIATKTGKNVNSGAFRQALADMVRFKMLVKNDDGCGYKLPTSGT